MKTSQLIAVTALSAVLWLVGAAAFAQSYKYDVPVELEGVLITATADPAVTFCEIAHQYQALKLHEPISVLCDPKEADCQPETGITMLHLMLKDKQLAQFKKLKGKTVKLNGTLFHADSGHHFTTVLMDVKSMAR